MTHAPEFSRLIAIEGITPDKTRSETITATEEECTALAERFGLRQLSNLKADLTIRRVLGGATVQVKGRLTADLVQACVVTLRDVPARIDAPFETFFAEEKKNARDIDFTAEDEEDAAEIIENGMIDMGEAVAQYLSLELDPYPRAPGVKLPSQSEQTGDDKKPNPFAALGVLKKAGKDK
jgi:uncharacterized metal-binding protein YceD (DUF177 family)